MVNGVAYSVDDLSRNIIDFQSHRYKDNNDINIVGQTGSDYCASDVAGIISDCGKRSQIGDGADSNHGFSSSYSSKKDMDTYNFKAKSAEAACQFDISSTTKVAASCANDSIYGNIMVNGVAYSVDDLSRNIIDFQSHRYKDNNDINTVGQTGSDYCASDVAGIISDCGKRSQIGDGADSNHGFSSSYSSKKDMDTNNLEAKSAEAACQFDISSTTKVAASCANDSIYGNIMVNGVAYSVDDLSRNIIDFQSHRYKDNNDINNVGQTGSDYCASDAAGIISDCGKRSQISDGADSNHGFSSSYSSMKDMDTNKFESHKCRGGLSF